MSPNSPWQRSPQLLTPSRSCLTIIDVQEKLLPSIEDSDAVISSIRFLLDAAGILQVRTVVTEQYPKGLGKTVVQLAGHPAVSQTLEKLRFSAAESLHEMDVVLATDNQSMPRQIILAGIEAHICVQQTALDLVAAGHSVALPVDAVGSRHSRDKVTAIERMRSSGVIVTTSEAIAFEWCEKAGSEQFRKLSRLVKLRDQA